MTSQSRRRSRRSISLRVSYDLKSGAFKMPAYIQVSDDAFIENPAVKYLSGKLKLNGCGQTEAHAVAQVPRKFTKLPDVVLRILDGGRADV